MKDGLKMVLVNNESYYPFIYIGWLSRDGDTDEFVLNNYVTLVSSEGKLYDQIAKKGLKPESLSPQVTNAPIELHRVQFHSLSLDPTIWEELCPQ